MLIVCDVFFIYIVGVLQCGLIFSVVCVCEVVVFLISSGRLKFWCFILWVMWFIFFRDGVISLDRLIRLVLCLWVVLRIFCVGIIMLRLIMLKLLQVRIMLMMFLLMLCILFFIVVMMILLLFLVVLLLCDFLVLMQGSRQVIVFFIMCVDFIICGRNILLVLNRLLMMFMLFMSGFLIMFNG